MKKQFNQWRLKTPLLKFDLKMKLTTFLLFTALIGLQANDGYAQKTKVTLDVENATVLDIIDDIEAITDFRFIYKVKVVNLQRKLSIKLEQEKIDVVLERLFGNTATDYKVRGTQIILRPSSDKPKKVQLKVEQDPIEITGVVMDEDGMPLPGANIVEKGTTNGVTADFDGNFSIKVADENARLVVSYIGFATKEVPVLGQTSVLVSLNEDAAGLEQVVVIGYGAVKKSDLTGSVTSIDTEQIENIPVNQVGQLLQGRSTGLQITAPSDDPEAVISVQIRGASSLFGSREPLVVLDGIPFGTLQNLNQINPGDIKSIEILKDASAAAIYGSQGANGVILVTTKTGSVGKPEVFIETSYTVGGYTKDFERFKDLELYANIENTENINDGLAPSFDGTVRNGTYNPSPQEFANGTYRFYDWLPLLRNLDPVTESIRAGVNGGTENNKYRFSLSYLDQEGSVKGDQFKKLIVFFKDAIDITDKLKFQISTSFSDGKREFGTAGNPGRAWIKPFNEDGSYFIPEDEPNYFHPLVQKEDQFNQRTDFDVLANAELTWRPFPWLTASSKFSYNHLADTFDEYQKAKYTELFNSYSGIGSVREAKQRQTYLTNTLTFQKEFGEAHDLSVMVGRDDQIKKNRFIEITGRDFVTDDLLNENLPSATIENQLIDQGFVQEDLLSYYSRVNYNLLDKYLLTLTFRADGSSKFGENEKWGYFPAVALAWKMHEENFLKDVSYIDFLKLRVSGGITGNQGIQPYLTLPRLNDVSVYDWELGQNVLSAGPGDNLGNPNLRWESTEHYNAAIETAFFNSRLRFSAEAYFKHTTDLSRTQFLAPSAGANSIRINNGVIDNWGLEFQLGGDIVRTENVSFSADLNFSMNRNEVVDIGTAAGSGLIEDFSGNQFIDTGLSVQGSSGLNMVNAIGEPLSSFYGFISEGVIQTEEQKALGFGARRNFGDFRYRDLNGNGIVDDQDRTIIGDPTPDFIASLNLSFSYKNFDMSAMFNGVYGNDILDRQREFRPYGKTNAWSLDNQETVFPALSNSRNFPNNTFYIMDGSFLRLSALTAGYNLVVPEQNFFKKVRFFFSGTNVFIIDNDFEGYDPEVYEADSSLTGGGAIGLYRGGDPRQRKFTIGVNLTF